MGFYGDLLTERQRSFMELYYNQNLSLGEIAESESVTRQCVYDHIKRGEHLLDDTEKKLGMLNKYLTVSRLTDECMAILGNASQGAAADIRDRLTAIKDVWEDEHGV